MCKSPRLGVADKPARSGQRAVDTDPCVKDDTEVTLKRNPKTDGLRRATQKANMRA